MIANVVAVPGVLLMFWLDPLMDPVVAVTVPDATVTGVVNDTVATPLEFVVDVDDANEPPMNVVVHVTVWPAVGTALSPASASCAVTVTEPPAVGVALDTVTRYFAAGPCGVTVTADEDAPPPIPFTARNWIEYDVPFVNPATVNGEVVEAGEIAVHEPPPSSEYS